MAVGKPKIILWKPGTVVRNPKIYLDANFLVGLAWPWHVWNSSANLMLAHLAEQQTGLALSSLAMNEAIFQLKSFEQKANQKQAALQNEAVKQAETSKADLGQEEEFDDNDDNDYADEPDLRRYRLKPAKTSPVAKPKSPQWPDLLEQMLAKLPNLGFFEPDDTAFHLEVIRAVHQFKLDPTDAFHYAAAKQLDCPILTNDAGFQKIPDAGLTVITFFIKPQNSEI